MWTDIQKYAVEYQSAVLTILDDEGYPLSLRCQVQPDSETQTLCLALPYSTALTGGPACLLWHRHDERLWNLHSFVVRGTLIEGKTGWYVRPEQFIPGVGIGGWRSYLHFLINGRRTTRRYLDQRNLDWPKLNWGEWRTLMS